MIKFEAIRYFALPSPSPGCLLAFRRGAARADGEIARQADLDRGRDGVLPLGRHGGSTGWSIRTSTRAIAHQDAPPAHRSAVSAVLPGVSWRPKRRPSFFLAAGELNRLCLRLAPVALGPCFLFLHQAASPLFSHLVLGFCLGIAPRRPLGRRGGSLDPRILWLTAAVTFWTGGFDVVGLL